MTIKQYVLATLAVFGFIPFLLFACIVALVGAPFALHNFYSSHRLDIEDDEEVLELHV